MENLAPSEAYDADETGYWKRMPLAVGLLAGLAAGAYCALPFFLGPAPNALVGLVTFLAVSGVVCFTARRVALAFRRRVAPSIEAIYGDYSALAAEAGPPESFSYRLPCVWLKFDEVEVGGVLYLGAGGLVFVPHLPKGASAAAHTKPLKLGPLDDLRLEISRPRLGLWRRALYERPPQFLEITAQGRRQRFAVPQAETTLEKISHALHSLKRRDFGPAGPRVQIPAAAGPRAAADELPGGRLADGDLTPLERVIKDS